MKLSFALLAFILCASPVAAQQTVGAADAYNVGIGFAAQFPALGLSGMYDVTDQISVQGIAGFFGAYQTLAGRGIYRFLQQPTLDVYGAAGLGHVAWRFGGFTALSSLYANAGAGIEINWGELFGMANPFPIMSMIDLGYTVVFDDGDPFSSFAFGGIMLSGGIHYRF